MSNHIANDIVREQEKIRRTIPIWCLPARKWKTFTYNHTTVNISHRADIEGALFATIQDIIDE